MTNAMPNGSALSADLRQKFARAADLFALLLVASLPISTSATSVLVGVWAVCLLPTVTMDELRRVLRMPAVYLALMFFALGGIGMLWADVSLAERLDGFASFTKFVAIPLLILQFARKEAPDRAALMAYLGACAGLLLFSIVLYLMPSLYWRDFSDWPTPVKNVPTQSGEFTACIFVLTFLAVNFWRTQRRQLAALCALLAGGFLVSVAFMAIGRTALVVALVLLPMLCFKLFKPSRAAYALTAAVAACIAIWILSPHLQKRSMALLYEAQSYRTAGKLTSSGERLEFWKKSLLSVARAPVFGHGTGSVPQQMKIETQGQTGPYATVTPNPHQQTLVVAVQIGLVGVVLLLAMWIAHLTMFRGISLAAWTGIVVVVQNIVGSLFNSHLFDFTQGWFYVVAFGIAAGAMVRQRETKPAGL